MCACDACRLSRVISRRSHDLPDSNELVRSVIRAVDGKRTGIMLGWGLIPYFAKGIPPKYSTINATIEKLESGPSWRGPWKRGQRCIMPARAFYEWHMSPDQKKNPYLIKLADQEYFGFAAI